MKTTVPAFHVLMEVTALVGDLPTAVYVLKDGMESTVKTVSY